MKIHIQVVKYLNEIGEVKIKSFTTLLTWLLNIFIKYSIVLGMMGNSSTEAITTVI